MNWAGYPLHLFGISDNHGSFHLVAIGFSTRENQAQFEFFFKAIQEAIKKVYGIDIHFDAFMSDACLALKKAFKVHFPDAIQTICWFHVKKAIKQRAFTKQENRVLFMEDINKLHLCPSAESFDVGEKLLIKKWQKKEKAVVTYLKKQWLSPSNKCWFAGAISPGPSTNNAVEATNCRLKNDFDFRTRSKLNVFQQKVLRIINVFSCEYRDNIKVLKWDVPIRDAVWKDAVSWAKSNKKPTADLNPVADCTAYYIPAGDGINIAKEALNAYVNKKWAVFDEFVEIRNSIWYVKLPTNNLDGSTCTCPAFLKENVCKHILGMRLRMQTIDVPDRINVVEKKQIKRGRPARIPPALVRE